MARVRSARIAPDCGTSTISTSAISTAMSVPKRATGRSMASGPRPAPIITMSSLSV